MKKTVSKKETKITRVTGIVEGVANDNASEALENTIDIIKKEYGDFVLTRKMKNELAKELDVDKKSLDGLEKVADVLDHIDIAVLAKKHPDAIGKVVKGVGSVVGFFIPAVSVAANAVPEKIVPKVVEVAGMFTPEHLANVLIKKQIKKKRENEETKMEEIYETADDDAKLNEAVEVIEEDCTMISDSSGNN